MRHPLDGAVAQLGERVVRNDEVRSSILLSSTSGGSHAIGIVAKNRWGRFCIPTSIPLFLFYWIQNFHDAPAGDQRLELHRALVDLSGGGGIAAGPVCRPVVGLAKLQD